MPEIISPGIKMVRPDQIFLKHSVRPDKILYGPNISWQINIENGTGSRLISGELREMEESRLRMLVLGLDEVFARNHKRPARYKLTETHIILTGDSPPQKLLPRRVPPHWEQEIDRQLDEMLAAYPTICRPSNSPWASDVVLVKKKEGSMRFAMDYRKLNTVTKRDEYSLPNPQSIFDKLEGSRFFSKLDIAFAYWTIPIAPEDVKKRMFYTPRGIYEMLVMHLGLWNAPATFQRVMDRAVQGTPCRELRRRHLDIFTRFLLTLKSSMRGPQAFTGRRIATT